ncbi:MAG: ATP-binding protein [Thermomicrobiales bacterium]|nr:ATP-binding protein [Thermomicrobiales bacterium]MCO5219269.1 ATP-binding protein [Thermomicrobiales bacterium]MCO5224026.1 ATP-binding protein [Thermomicrobiales bacterium]MCO5226846.1 ATP-binding protein [Thermomicrobiales bacterium]
MSGPPAAGKTTNARPLADALGLPLFALDPIKERLADVIGPDALAIADTLSVAATQQLLATASEVITAGGDVMIEGFFRSGEFDHLLLPLVTRTQAVLIHLWAEDLLLKDRYERRAVNRERHWIHGDEARIGTLTPELPEDMRPALDLGIPRIYVNTSHAVTSVDDLVAEVKKALRTTTSSDIHLGESA